MRKAAFIILLAAFAAGCCSIMSGTKQEIGISSKPTRATVIIDNKEYGSTPIVVNLSRKDKHFIKIVMPGYEPYETALTRGTNGWVWGNIIFGGLIGLAIDAISGSMYKLKPSNVEGELTKKNASIEKLEDLVYIVFTLKPDPAWEKIGSLTPISE